MKNIISKENKSPNLVSFHRNYTSSARSAFQFILSLLKKNDKRGILIPSYIGFSSKEGSGVFDPIKKTKFNYSFYRVNEKLQPDLKDIQQHLETGKYQAIFLIHYFGIYQCNSKEFVKMCHSYNVKVIEDCAHLISDESGMNGVGQEGDFAIYSIHKNTASNSGGFFVDNNEHEIFEIDLSSQIDEESLKIFSNTNLHQNAKTRINNYLEISKWVTSLYGIELIYKNIPKGFVPLNCPIIVSHNKREELYNALVQKNLWPTALYHTLISEVKEADFPEAHYLSKNILNLPTHPGVKESDYDTYKKILSESVKNIFKF